MPMALGMTPRFFFRAIVPEGIPPRCIACAKLQDFCDTWNISGESSASLPNKKAIHLADNITRARS